MSKKISKKINKKLPLVSVILGFKDGANYLERFYNCLDAQTYSNIEIISVDNYSKDGASKIAKARSDQYYVQGPERSSQRNLGIKKSTGKYCLILDSDQYLGSKVIQECVEIIENNKNIQACFIPEETLASGFWGKCKKFERDFYLIGDISAEAARFYIRENLLQLDPPGFDETQTGSEDWDLTDRYIGRFGNYSRCQDRIIHDEGKINLKNQIAKKRYYSRLGISNYLLKGPTYRRIPFPLRPSVLKQFYKLPLHPILTIGTIYMKFVEGLTIFSN
ncbi:glycosyltransferase [Candidatus Gracilibacteria bacterium]|nr:glycosyltransferase [Candidatus Gracilibacteria bacterium]